MLEHVDEDLQPHDDAEVAEYTNNRLKYLANLRKRIAAQPAHNEERPERLGWYDEVANWIESNRERKSGPDETIHRHLTSPLSHDTLADADLLRLVDRDFPNNRMTPEAQLDFGRKIIAGGFRFRVIRS
jgi:hypothetical protein